MFIGIFTEKFDCHKGGGNDGGGSKEGSNGGDTGGGKAGSGESSSNGGNKLKSSDVEGLPKGHKWTITCGEGGGSPTQAKSGRLRGSRVGGVTGDLGCGNR